MTNPSVVYLVLLGSILFGVLGLAHAFYTHLEQEGFQRKQRILLMNAWNILVDVRRSLPQEPVPMDEAMQNLLDVMDDLGCLQEDPGCPCEHCERRRGKRAAS